MSDKEQGIATAALADRKTRRRPDGRAYPGPGGEWRGGGVAGLYSYEEEAEAFLRLQEPGKSWRARETTAEELVSLLYGHCKSIEKVALDPLPVAVDSRVVVDLTGPGRENFLRNFLAVDRSSLANQVKWVRQNEEERGGTENESAFDGSSKNLDGLYIPDYAMRDFDSSDGSCNGSDRRHSVLEVPGEDLVPRRE